MKRMRDDIYANPQFKRPFGSSKGESNGQLESPGSGVGGGGGGVAVVGSMQKLTTNDALTYLKEVKDMFQDQREKYDMFLDVMKDFKAQRIDTAGVIGRVKELFKGHPNLILGFNTFLPKGYEITLTDVEEAPPRRTVEFEEAISFVNKIKKRFQNDDHVYKSFLDILNMYRKEHKGINEVYQEVAQLFVDDPDLLDEFKKFLPDTSGTASATPASFARHSFNRYDERSSVMPSLRHSPLDKQRLQKDRTVSLQTDPDRNVERPGLDDDKYMKFHKEQKKREEKESRDRKYRDQDYRELNNENNGVLSVDRLGERKKSARIGEEFGGHPTLASSDDKGVYRNMYSEELKFCEKVKERLHSPDDYQAFLRCLHIYSTEIINRKELQSLVADLLGKYPDLMEGFNDFLERCEQVDGFLAGVMRKKSLWIEGHASKSPRTEERDREHNKREIDGGKEKDRSKEKYWGKSIQELDLSDCPSCTPSYRLLPDDYPIHTASQRSELGAQVLNDHWVSVTSGSEDYSFKHMRRNQYEESLFRCEDDRFELDMLLESVSSAAKRAEELLNSTNDNSVGADNSVRIEDHFTVLNLRCIERLYGDHGLDVMDILRRNASLALPVILTRLKQKQEEWTKCRSDFNKVWAEIYAKNHYKSLDHRSFYFKQQDSKNLCTKSLVAEIKELKEKQQKDDDVLLTVAAGNRHPLSPNLEFGYTDLEIHEDLYKLVKYSCEEVCSTKELLNKVMSLWTTFIEPLLGVPPQRHDQETTEDDELSKHGTLKSTSSHDNNDPGAGVTAMSKHPKLICNGDANNSPQRLSSCRGSFANTDATKEDGTAVRGERPTNSVSALPSLADGNPARNSFDRTSGGGVNSSQAGIGVTTDSPEAKPNMHDKVPSEDSDPSRSATLAKEGLAEISKLNGHHDDLVEPSKNEKEEGELSNGDFEEDNFAAYQDGGPQTIVNASLNDESIQHLDREGKRTSGHDASVEHDGEADDEDFEHVYEGGEDISGSESAADECSQEEQGDEEDGEHEELDEKAESEGEAECASHFVGGDGASLPHSERFLLTSKPLKKYVMSPIRDNENKCGHVFYGNDTFYVLFRLHQILYERLLSAKLKSSSSDQKWGVTKDRESNPYAKFIHALYGLLDGSADNVKFEDECRSIFGNQSYVLFTLDKLIYKLVKQLQTVSSDELDVKLIQLYEYEKCRKAEKYVDSVYYENAHVFLHDENIYRFESKCYPTYLSIQLIDDGSEKSEVVAVSVEPTFATYLYSSYLSPNNVKKDVSAIMLKRNKWKYANVDESTALCLAMENVLIVNGLECKMSSNSSKISYVLDTEDFFLRIGSRRSNKSGRSSFKYQARVKRFNQFLMASLQ